LTTNGSDISFDQSPELLEPGSLTSNELRIERIFSCDRGHTDASSIIETPAGALIVVWYENGGDAGAVVLRDRDLDRREDVRIAAARRESGRLSGVSRSYSPIPQVFPTTTLRSGSTAKADCGWCTRRRSSAGPISHGEAPWPKHVSSDYDRAGGPLWRWFAATAESTTLRSFRRVTAEPT